MKRHLFIALLVAGTLACAVQLYAHHSFTATYHEDQTVKIEGKMVQFQFRNPHSFVQILDDKGIRWSVEWGGAGQLGGQGVTRETLKPGDVVVITGNPAARRKITESAWSASSGPPTALAGAENRGRPSIKHAWGGPDAK